MDAYEENLANLRVASFSYYLKPGEESFVQKINGRVDDPLPAILSQEPSFPISPGIRAKSTIIKPTQNFNFSQPINSQDGTLSNHHQLVAPFSPHLNDAKETIVFRVKAPIKDLNAALLSPQTCSTQIERISASSNGEIGVFGADKYFNMRLECEPTVKSELENERTIGVPGLKSNLTPGTPTISSQASSWNSQAALLGNLSQKESAETRPRRTFRRRFFASFGCGGPCLDKEAVIMKENKRGDAQIMATGASKRSDHFAFPVLNDSKSAKNATIKKPPLEDHEKEVEAQRKSLEVFGSSRRRNGDIAVNLARKLSMLTWDAIPKSANATSTTVGSTTICDDMTSDASSDLFEIEDISGTAYSVLSTMEEAAQHHGNVSAGCMSPPTQYAPSEASIEWSVVTASAADFLSVISDYDEKNIGISGDTIHTNSGHRNPRTKNLEGKEAQNGRSGGLLGCKSQKAVNVAETVVQKTKVVERC